MKNLSALTVWVKTQAQTLAVRQWQSMSEWESEWMSLWMSECMSQWVRIGSATWGFWLFVPNDVITVVHHQCRATPVGGTSSNAPVVPIAAAFCATKQAPIHSECCEVNLDLHAHSDKLNWRKLDEFQLLAAAMISQTQKLPAINEFLQFRTSEQAPGCCMLHAACGSDNCQQLIDILVCLKSSQLLLFNIKFAPSDWLHFANLGGIQVGLNLDPHKNGNHIVNSFFCLLMLFEKCLFNCLQSFEKSMVLKLWKEWLWSEDWKVFNHADVEGKMKTDVIGWDSSVACLHFGCPTPTLQKQKGCSATDCFLENGFLNDFLAIVNLIGPTQHPHFWAMINSASSNSRVSNSSCTYTTNYS